MSNLPSISAAEYESLVQSWRRPSRLRPDLPSRRRIAARLAALHYILIGFEQNRDYPEAEVNAIIQRHNLFSVDHVNVRRDMVEYRMLERTADGARYRRTQGYLELAQWDPAIPKTRLFPSGSS